VIIGIIEGRKILAAIQCHQCPHRGRPQGYASTVRWHHCLHCWRRQSLISSHGRGGTIGAGASAAHHLYFFSFHFFQIFAQRGKNLAE
jgi:hypothetical protein